MLVTRVLEYKGYHIEANADQDHDLIWEASYKIDPEPEVLRTTNPSVFESLPTRGPWNSVEDAIGGAIAEARAVVDIQIREAGRR
jgi:hypothetical protein